MKLKSLWKGEFELEYFHKRTYLGQALCPALCMHDLTPLLQPGSEEVRVACKGKMKKQSLTEVKSLAQVCTASKR